MADARRSLAVPEMAASNASLEPSVEQLLHQRLSLTATLIAFIAAPILSFTLQKPLWVVIPAMSYGGIMLAVYLAARRGQMWVKLTYYLALLLTAVVWFPASGSQGGELLYQTAVMIYGLVMLRGRARIIAMAAVMLLAGSLITIEQSHPEFVRPFVSDTARAIQLSVSASAAMLTSMIILGAVIASYDRERGALGQSISALHASQQALAESESTLTALVNSTRDLVWLIEPGTFTLTRFNDAFAAFVREQSGLTVETGQAIASVWPATASVDWVDYSRRALASGAFTTEVTTTSGQTLLASISPVRHGDRMLGISAHCVDITELRQQQQARADLERQRLDGQRMESLGRLAGGVAHDYNNMLAAILGHAEIMRDEATDGSQLEHLTAIEQAANRSGDLTRKLLAFGRRGKNVTEGVSLTAVVRDCLVILRPSMRADVRVTTDLRATALVDGDPSQLSQIVLNLCLNANDAMPDGGMLHIATRNLDADVELVVRDSGVGMTDDVKARIFEPFFTTKTEGTASGTGLGLATVHGVVHLHGGTVSAESRPGFGSTFSVRLPKGTTAQRAVAMRPTRADDEGMILVVDDEPLVREVIKVSLRSLGYGSVTAADGVEGMALFQQQHARLSGVVLDLKMPKMSGRDTFMAMRAHDASVPVLICSGYGDNEEVEALVRAGARGLVKKPFTRQMLADALALLAH